MFLFQASSNEEKRELRMQLSIKCKDMVGANDADLKELQAKEVPTTKPGKCLRKCLFEEFNVVRYKC